jgi:hypothetical protein
MNNTTHSILLATLIAACGLAAAQNPAVPATRAEVKAQAGTAERKAGTGEPIKPSTGTMTQGNTSNVTRAEVKSEAGMTERKAGTGDTLKPNKSDSVATQGNTSGTTRAEVKAEAGTEPRRLGTGEVAKPSKPSAGSIERKRLRDERRAAAKAKREASMKTGSS